MMNFKIIIYLFISIIILVEADYFDILEKEYKEKIEGKIRRFYITAEEEIWDYASQLTSDATIPSNNKMGTKYYKAVYHAYQDISYTKRLPKPDWQGNMGPIIRVEVGDIIQIFFWNRASKNFTIHPHGVFYEFEMEGAIFQGSFEDSMVSPNENYTYTWNVLPRAGPGPRDGNSIVWGYHSHVSENDIYAGLYGAILVYRPGTLSNQDIVTSVFISDESLSPYLSQTMSEIYLGTKNKGSKEHQFYTINGLIASSPKDLVIKNKSVDWHLLGWGTYYDVQYLKWEKSQVLLFNHPVDSIRLMPASFYTATVLPTSKDGLYQFGAIDHTQDGMFMKYSVSLLKL